MSSTKTSLVSDHSADPKFQNTGSTTLFSPVIAPGINIQMGTETLARSDGLDNPFDSGSHLLFATHSPRFFGPAGQHLSGDGIGPAGQHLSGDGFGEVYLMSPTRIPPNDIPFPFRC